MALRVIGAGFGRTGTHSLKTALEQLGFGKCYHMVELFRNRSGIVHWEDARKQRGADWEALFDGYQSAVDFPACLYFEELLHFYADAKVVLTVRDTESWYASARDTILNVKPTLRQSLAIIARLPFSREARLLAKIGMHNVSLISKPLADERTAKRVYEEHNERVRQVVPADRLLEYEVKRGWGPLCDFLGVPIPADDFPQSNKRENFGEFVRPLLDP